MKLPEHVPVLAYGAEALVPLTPEVKSLLTLTDKFGEPYVLYRHEFKGSPNGFVPRGLVDASKAPNYTISNPVPKTFAIKPPQTEEQARVIAESFELLQRGIDHVVEAPTGFGKTYVGCSVAGKLGQKTLIVVTKNDLIKGWKDTLIHLFGVNPSEIGHVQQDTVKFQNCRFVVAMIHSLVCRDYDPTFYRSFGLVIFDESGSKDTLVTTSKGQIRFEDLVKNKIECEVLSYNTATGEYEWKPILAYHEHPPRNPLMRITHEYGYLDFTSEHLFYTDRGWVPVRELVPGDCLYLDTLHSLQYTNSESLENEHGIMATRHSVGGREHVPVERRAEGETEVQPFKQAIGVGAGKVPEAKGFRFNPTKTIFEWWVGGKEYVVHDHHAKVVSPLLPRKLFSRGETDTRAIDCTARPAGVVGLVDDGRRDLHCGVFGAVVEQVSRAGREGVVRFACAEGVRKLRSVFQRLVYHIFSGGQQVVEAGINAVLHTKYAVQAGVCSLWGKNLSVQSVWGRHLLPSWSKKGLLLQEGDMPEGEKVHELPSSLRAPTRAGQRESSCMGTKTRVLSVTPLPEPDLVYDIEVADNHNFVANGVVVHNCHRLGADYFAQVCAKFPSRHRLGLSATPTRSDGKEKLFIAHIGPVMVRGSWVPMNPKILVKHTGWKVPIVPQREDDGVWRKSPMKVVPGRMMPVIKAIAADFARNKEIAHFVKSAYDAGRYTVVMSDLIEDHLQPLFHLIVAEGIPGNDIAYYHGQVKKDQLEVAKTKRVVLATYSMCGEGTNVPHWDTLVLATPRSNVKQAIGRVLRKVEGKKQPVILDLVDDHEILKNFYFSRLKQYYSVGAEIVRV